MNGVANRPADPLCQDWQREGHEETNDGINRERLTAKRRARIERRRLRIHGPEDLLGGGKPEEHPHAEQSQPGKELDDGQLLHGPRHLAQSRRDFRSGEHRSDRRSDSAAEEKVPGGEMMLDQSPPANAEQQAGRRAPAQERRLNLEVTVRARLRPECHQILRRVLR
jgi:hypothetical protein